MEKGKFSPKVLIGSMDFKVSLENGYFTGLESLRHRCSSQTGLEGAFRLKKFQYWWVN